MNTLHPFQEEAVDRIVDRKQLLVAYEMGLGKTPLTISALEQLMDDEHIQHTVLIVVLASLKYQWEKEINKWAPDSKVAVIDGPPAKRRKIYDALVSNEPVDYVICNYETVVRDDFYQTVRWGAIVLDEATSIKSFRSKRAKKVKKLAKNTEVRIALTGTPIANGKPEELFSMMEFVDPSVLGRFDLFDRAFIIRNPNGWVERYRNLPTLHRAMEPAMVRKRQADEDVAPFLPDVLDMPPELISFDRNSASLYRHIARELITVLDEAAELFGAGWNFNVASHYGQGGQDANPEEVAMRGEIMSRIQALRMLCSHPEALRVSANNFASRLTEQSEVVDGPGTGSIYAYSLREQGMLDVNMGAPKLDAVAQRLRDFVDIALENKAVVFSSFRTVMPIMADELSALSPVQFHGGMNAKQKEAAKVRFQTDPNCRVFISSDAGGFGVDLPQANLLINYDLPWASATAMQRNSRIIRASSDWSQVRIERYLMDGTLELRQWDALQYKQDVSNAIIDGGRTDDRGNVLSTVTALREILSACLV